MRFIDLIILVLIIMTAGWVTLVNKSKNYEDFIMDSVKEELSEGTTAIVDSSIYEDLISTTPI